MSQGSSVAVTWNWSWEGIKPRYEGHPLANCDFGKNVWCVVGKELVGRTPRWGITDAGPTKPRGQRPSTGLVQAESRTVQELCALQFHHLLTLDSYLNSPCFSYPVYGRE